MKKQDYKNFYSQLHSAKNITLTKYNAFEEWILEKQEESER
ncbi:hypothetical protein [Aliivibrio fischeri]|nr:hypothetical protein [Aliivibrio fischeri]